MNIPEEAFDAAQEAFDEANAIHGGTTGVGSAVRAAAPFIAAQYGTSQYGVEGYDKACRFAWGYYGDHGEIDEQEAASYAAKYGGHIVKRQVTPWVKA